MGQTEIVKLLLEHGAGDGVSETSLTELEALPLACSNGHLDVVKLLMDAGFVDRAGQQTAAAPIENVKPLLTAAGEAGHASVLAQLLVRLVDRPGLSFILRSSVLSKGMLPSSASSAAQTPNCSLLRAASTSPEVNSRRCASMLV